MKPATGMAVGRPKRKRDGEPQPGITVGLRVSHEYRAWLEELAEHYRTTVAGVIDRALAEWTASENFPKRPPRRIP